MMRSHLSIIISFSMPCGPWSRQLAFHLLTGSFRIRAVFPVFRVMDCAFGVMLDLFTELKVRDNRSDVLTFLNVLYFTFQSLISVEFVLV